MASLAAFRSAFEFMLFKMKKPRRLLPFYLFINTVKRHIFLFTSLSLLNMKYFALFLTVLFAVFACSQANVVQLTDKNFDELVSEKDEWLIDL